jgi:hypoxanthine-guanine phosphoribosyltransferase
MDKDRQKERKSFYDTPYISFPNHPKKLNLDNHEVYRYICPEIMSGLIDNLCRKIDYSKFDTVLVNMKGGKFLYDEIVKRKGEPISHDVIEYHQAKGGFGAIVIIPVSRNLDGKKCLIIDDILDTGGVFKEIVKNLSENSLCVALVQKINVKDQIEIKNKIVGTRIDNVWVGGCGMNLETEGDGLPKDYLRAYPGLVAKIL